MEMDNYIPPDFVTSRKMFFILNTLNDGWTVKKKNDNYIFIKNHEGRKEVINDSYLKDFIVKNLEIEKEKCDFS